MIVAFLRVRFRNKRDEKQTMNVGLFEQNLLEKPESDKVSRDNAMTMIACRLVKPLELLSTKKFDDEDINENIQFIKEKLEGNLEDVTYANTKSQ